MKKLLRHLSQKQIKRVIICLLMTFSFTKATSVFAKTYCGYVSGFEFSNGDESVPIINRGTYQLSELPNDFYIDVLVSGYSESASIKIKNLDTGESFKVGENYLPYTNPANGNAWSYGTGTFVVYAKLYRYNHRRGRYCDKEKIRFTISNTPPCGQIDGLEFSNGLETVSITDGGNYDIMSLPDNFYLDAIVSGESESLRFEVLDLNTGETYSIIENYLPYTFPAGSRAWFLGTGTFQVKVASYSGNYCRAQLCDELSITFTISERNCGSISGFEFSNFADPAVAIVDGASYNINAIPTNFNINVLISGNTESAANTLTNLDTGEVFTNLENVLPYTFPGATTQFWTLGCGRFKFCSTVYEYNNANGLACDSFCVTFTFTGCEDDTINCEDTFAGTGTIESFIVSIDQSGVGTLTVMPNGDAVLPEGFILGLVVTEGPDLIVRALSDTTEVDIDFFGEYRVHLFAYDATIDLSPVVFGQTEVSEILNTIEENDLCASIEPIGIPFIALPTARTKNGDVAHTQVKLNEVLRASNESFRLYPNPVVNALNVELSLLDAEIMNFKVIDLSGKQILSGAFNTTSLGKTKINTSMLANGLYIITFESNFRRFSKKIQVVK